MSSPANAGMEGTGLQRCPSVGLEEAFLSHINQFSRTLQQQLACFTSGLSLAAKLPPDFRERADLALAKVNVQLDHFRVDLCSAVTQPTGGHQAGEHDTELIVAQERVELSFPSDQSHSYKPMRSTSLEGAPDVKGALVPLKGVLRRKNSSRRDHEESGFQGQRNSVVTSLGAGSSRHFRVSGSWTDFSEEDCEVDFCTGGVDEASLARPSRVKFPAQTGSGSSNHLSQTDAGETRLPCDHEPSGNTAYASASGSFCGSDDGDSQSTIDIKEEEDDAFPSGRCVQGVLNPNWPGRLAWDMGTMLIVLLDAMVLPFQMAYKDSDTPDVVDTSWLYFTTTFFFLDIVMNFFTGYAAGKRDTDMEPGRLVTSKFRIMRHYARTWMTIDVVSTVPWGLLSTVVLGGESSGAGQLGKLTKVVKFVRFMRLMRMLRLAKLAMIWERIEAKCGSIMLLQGVSLLRVLFVLVCICHWNACIWWMIGQPRSLFTELLSDEALAEWEARPHWTTLMRSDGPGEPSWTWLERNTSEAYIFCFYWTLGVMRTMPAEVTPVSQPERVYIMIFMFFAFSAFAICVAQITQTFFKFSERRRNFNDDMAAVRMYLRQSKAGETLQQKIKGYLRHKYDTRQLQARELGMFKELDPRLTAQLKSVRLAPFVQKMRPFRNQIMPMLQVIADIAIERNMAAGEMVSHKDRIAEWATVLISGRLQVVQSRTHLDSLPSKMTRSVEVVDEECLDKQGEVRSKYSVVAIMASTVMHIKKKDYEENVRSKYPQRLSSGGTTTPGGELFVPTPSRRTTTTTIRDPEPAGDDDIPVIVNTAVMVSS